jgi:4-aminobutyrate aminotransferase/(S)-3-amino-2-methylpropionate transaminase
LGHIVRRTPLPGPKSAEILRRKDAVVAKPLSVYIPAVIDRTEGALVTDVDGNTYIDLSGGVGCTNVGHADPIVLEAVRAQAERFLHTDFTILPYASYVELAERLAAIAPGRGPKKVAFFNSGAEAVENAIKIARAFTRRQAVIAFEGAFHGRTLMAMTLTSRVVPYKKGFGPFAPEVYRAPYPYAYRSDAPERCGEACLEAVRRMFATTVPAEHVAAVIVEAVQGEGGFVVPPARFLQGLQQLCRNYGIVFIVDEVQTGFGRTGRMFACEHFGLEPDLITVAKSIAAGLPLSGVIGRADIMDAPGDNAIGGTFVGNPVACAAGLAVLDVIERRQLLERSRHIGEILMTRFRSFQERYPLVGDARGLGAMCAIELVRDRRTKEPADRECSNILRRAAERGAIFLKAGIYGNCIRSLAPLVISDEQLQEALDVLEGAIADERAPAAAEANAAAEDR